MSSSEGENPVLCLRVCACALMLFSPRKERKPKAWSWPYAMFFIFLPRRDKPTAAPCLSPSSLPRSHSYTDLRPLSLPCASLITSVMRESREAGLGSVRRLLDFPSRSPNVSHSSCSAEQKPTVHSFTFTVWSEPWGSTCRWVITAGTAGVVRMCKHIHAALSESHWNSMANSTRQHGLFGPTQSSCGIFFCFSLPKHAMLGWLLIKLIALNVYLGYTSEAWICC